MRVPLAEVLGYLVAGGGDLTVDDFEVRGCADECGLCVHVMLRDEALGSLCCFKTGWADVETTDHAVWPSSRISPSAQKTLRNSGMTKPLCRGGFTGDNGGFKHHLFRDGASMPQHVWFFTP
jgi:hypothetical protein